MTFARQLLAVILTASLLWTGFAGAAQAHTHEQDAAHGAGAHALALHAHIDHHSAAYDTAPADAGVVSQTDPGKPDPGKPDHEKGVLHVHSLCFVALEAQYTSLIHFPAVRTVEPTLLVVPLHTRSITPADRPPRTFL